MKIKKLKKEEILYTYKNPNIISVHTGLIGYVRADFGPTGREFYHTWWGFRLEDNSESFSETLDRIIGFYRKKGRLLSDRQTLEKFVNDTSNEVLEFGKDYGFGDDYGVRIDEGDYAFLMRLNPLKGNYNFYCYCYKKDWLDSHIPKAKKGIRFIDSHYNEKFRIADGEKVIIKYPNHAKSRTETCRYIDDYHFILNKNIFHICEFAELAEQDGQTVEPATRRINNE